MLREPSNTSYLQRCRKNMNFSSIFIGYKFHANSNETINRSEEKNCGVTVLTLSVVEYVGTLRRQTRACPTRDQLSTMVMNFSEPAVQDPMLSFIRYRAVDFSFLARICNCFQLIELVFCLHRQFEIRVYVPLYIAVALLSSTIYTTRANVFCPRFLRPSLMFLLWLAVAIYQM